MKNLGKPCEICGKPATSGVRDIIIRIVNGKTGYWEFGPDGPPHYYCQEHDRKSIEREGPPILPSGISFPGLSKE